MLQTRDFWDYAQITASILSPVVLLFMSGLGWWIKKKVESSEEFKKIEIEKIYRQEERIKGLEDQLREDRIDIYNQLLEPFILLFVNEEYFAKDSAYKNKKRGEVVNSILTSVEYRKTVVKLSLVGSDEVVRSYNDLMQFFYSAGVTEGVDISSVDKESRNEKILNLISGLLLSIRKSMGNTASQLNQYEMLESFVKDIRVYKKILDLNSNKI